MTEIVVDNRIRVRDLHTERLATLKEQFTHRNPTYYKQKAMGFKVWKEKPSIRTWSVDGEWTTFPLGGLDKVREVAGLCTISDKRVTGTGPTAELVHNLKLWDHQEKIVRLAIDQVNGVVRSPTGSGKSSAAIALIARLGLPALVIVWSSNLMEQWRERLQAELGLSKRQIGTIRGKKFDIQPVTLAMQQTLNSRSLSKEDRELFGLVICDEVQNFAAPTFQKSIDLFPAKYRIGFSADETRADKKEFLIYDMFGPTIAEVDQATLIEKEIVHEVELRLIPSDFEAQWWHDWIRQFSCGRDGHHWDPKLRTCRLCNATKDVGPPEFNKLLEAMIEDPSRNKLILDLVQEIAKPTLILSHRVMHCRNLDSMLTGRGLDGGVLLGGSDEAELFEETRNGLRDGSLDYGVGTIQAVGVGQDIPAIQSGVLATPMFKNKQQLNQIKGRVCRTAEGKREAVLYAVWDRAIYGKKIVKQLSDWFGKVTILQDGQYTPADQYGG